MHNDDLSRFFSENMAVDGELSFQQWEGKVLDFAQRVSRGNCKGLALVSSGGTSVPLEMNAVRFVTNFSTGSRGAGLVEDLVVREWACILLHSESAQLPFRRVMDNMDTERFFTELMAPEKSSAVASIVGTYSKYKTRLLLVPYRTVVDYLYLLRLITVAVCHRAECLRTMPMVLLAAAAVSDYFIPRTLLSEHKISSNDGMTVHFSCVPKVLNVLSDIWHTADCDVSRLFVTFKLETHDEMLETKALKNLTLYNCDLVVANKLQEYKERVVMYWRDTPGSPTVLQRPPNGSIESLIVDCILRRIECDATGGGRS
uniref:DNA/pantothenate metabolism flavoprotein C-terminal domain-containing protein n=1 Tax=Trypanosoma congolense (strain IL3000) TaxID=1068625 RepID=G0UJX7_TRYCI|nr:conserved hypothetical protein [Trypanosoma congolense IL3000]